MRGILKKLTQRPVVIAACVMLALFFFIFSTYIWPVGELYIYDIRLGLLRSPRRISNLMFVAIDQDSLDKLGPFPWNRTRYAQLLKALDSKDAKIVIMDILFQEEKPEDAQLARTLREVDSPVVLSFSFDTINALGDQRVVDVVPTLKKAADGVGHISNSVDPDGKVRKVFLAKRVNERIFPSISLVGFALMNGVNPSEIKYRENSIVVGDLTIPTDDQYRMLVNYYFPVHTDTMHLTFPERSFAEILEQPDKLPDLSNTVVIVGAGAHGMQDDFPTPVEDKMFGPMIHANALNTMRERLFIKKAPTWLNLLITILIGFLFGFLVSRFNSVWKIAGTSAGVFVIYTVFNGILFQQGYWLDWLSPFFAIFSGALVVSGAQFFRTHKIFQQFMVREVVDDMVSSRVQTDLGGEEKEVSILFTDIRGYTSISENMTPSQVMQLLNDYHSSMVKVFERNQGRVFTYIGDAQLVVFGAPIKRDDHAACACQAALEAREVLNNLKKRWKVEKGIDFNIGVGICTGTAAVGVVGAEGMKQYTVIGDPVNVASRLEGKTKDLGVPIVISKTTAEQVKDKFEIESLGKIKVKGKAEPMEVFTIKKVGS